MQPTFCMLLALACLVACGRPATKGRVVGEERLLTDRGARFREVVIGRGGIVLLLTDGGEILKLQPKTAD